MVLSKFPFFKKDYSRIEGKNNICVNVMFGYENGLFYPVHVSDEKFKDSMDLLLLTGGNKLHYVYIKNFNRFMRHKTKHKIIKHFCRYCLQ